SSLHMAKSMCMHESPSLGSQIPVILISRPSRPFIASPPASLATSERRFIRHSVPSSAGSVNPVLRFAASNLKEGGLQSELVPRADLSVTDSLTYVFTSSIL